MNNLKSKLKKQGGFTLIEMLIVVAIIAILIAIAIPMVNAALESAREATDAANERAAIGIAMSEVLTKNTLAGQDASTTLVSAYYKIAPATSTSKSPSGSGTLVPSTSKPATAADGGCYGKGTALGDVAQVRSKLTIKVTYNPAATTEDAQWQVEWE